MPSCSLGVLARLVESIKLVTVRLLDEVIGMLGDEDLLERVHVNAVSPRVMVFEAIDDCRLEAKSSLSVSELFFSIDFVVDEF